MRKSSICSLCWYLHVFIWWACACHHEYNLYGHILLKSVFNVGSHCISWIAFVFMDFFKWQPRPSTLKGAFVWFQPVIFVCEFGFIHRLSNKLFYALMYSHNIPDICGCSVFCHSDGRSVWTDSDVMSVTSRTDTLLMCHICRGEKKKHSHASVRSEENIWNNYE